MLFLRYFCLFFFTFAICSIGTAAFLQAFFGVFTAYLNDDSDTPEISSNSHRWRLGFYLISISLLFWALPPLQPWAQVLGWTVTTLCSVMAIFHLLCLLGRGLAWGFYLLAQTKAWRKMIAWIDAEFLEEWHYHYDDFFAGLSETEKSSATPTTIRMFGESIWPPFTPAPCWPRD